jgi:hypothetical protein
MREGDVFDPTRLEISKRAMIFSVRSINGVVVRHWAQSRTAGHGFAFARLGGDAVKNTGWDSTLAVTLLPFLMPDPNAELVDIARGLNALTEESKEIQRATLAICAWTPQRRSQRISDACRRRTAS